MHGPRSSALVALALLVGCEQTNLLPVIPCSVAPEQVVDVHRHEEVDVLLVVDNSESMREEQALLVASLPGFIERLTSATFEPGNGVPDELSLHLGIITGDMGAANQVGVPTCAPGLGDDGILRNTSTSGAPCMATYPAETFAFMRGGDAARFAEDVACVASVGTSGCTYQQPLEAMLKALSPGEAQTWTNNAFASPRFVDGATGIADRLPGHGDSLNASFLRPRSQLMVVIVSDGDDCSVRDYALFGNDARFAGTPPALRCAEFGANEDIVQPTLRYVNGLRRLREYTSIAILAGFPDEPVVEPAGLLQRPEMEYRVDASGTALVPSCTSSHGDATPPRRLAEVGSSSWLLSSICAESYAPFFESVAARIRANQIRCVRRLSAEPQPNAEGCEVLEMLPSATLPNAQAHCADLPGRTLVGRTMRTGELREVCRVPFLPHALGEVPSGAGWYYARTYCTESHERVTFAASSPPAIGAEVSIRCPVDATQLHVCTATSESCEAGDLCEPGPDDGCASAGYVCDPLTRRCALSCTSNADCARIGYSTFTCDTRTLAEVQFFDPAPSEYARRTARNVCENPECRIDP